LRIGEVDVILIVWTECSKEKTEITGAFTENG